MTENFEDKVEQAHSKSIHLYGPFLGGDSGQQDYTPAIELRGVIIVNEKFFKNLVEERKKLREMLDKLAFAQHDSKNEQAFKAAYKDAFALLATIEE